MKRTLLLFFSLFFAVSLYSQVILTPDTDTDATPVIDRAVNLVVVDGDDNYDYARLRPLVSGTYTITTSSTSTYFGSQWVYVALNGIYLNSGNQSGPAWNISDVLLSTYLTAGETYVLSLKTTLPETIGLNIEFPTGGGLDGFVWGGSSGGDWSQNGNWNWNDWWDGLAVPKPWNNVTIPVGSGNVMISSSTQASCSDLNIESGSSLIVQSDATGTGSLIVTGTVTGTANVQRYMSGNAWHVVSGAVSGQNVSSFLTANTNIPVSSGKRGMTDYNTATNSWNDYFTTGSGTVDAGKGYLMRTNADGAVTFSGALTTGNKTVSVTDLGDGWNCIGNPYSSSINMNTAANASSNFLDVNSANLDPSYACVYVWEGSSASYKILGNSSFGARDLGQNVFTSGQGFFVKAKTGVSSMQFNSAMQTHQPTAVLKSATVAWPYLTINATSGQTKASTVVAFNNEMTRGLDPTYDAGLLRGANGLSLFSRLVEDNGVDFAIQCLPESYNNLVIPIGIDSKAGGEVVLSAQAVLPAGCNVILEDKTTNTYTSLSDGATYSAMLAANSQGTGRFYLHMSALTTEVDKILPDGKSKLKAYQSDNQLIIDGMVSAQAKVSLFSVNGILIGQYSLQQGEFNNISIQGFTSGIYLVRINDGNNQYNLKTIINQ